jgi:uncharacterized protein YwqG
VDGAPLSFIAQLNCEELSLNDGSGMLPKTGLISFFYSAEQEAWGFDPADRDKFCVLYHKDLSNLQQQNFPAALPEDSRYTANNMIFYSTLSMPDWGHEIVQKVFNEKESDRYGDLAAGTENQVLGYATRIQGNMELECQLVTNGLYCGDPTGYSDPRREQLQDGVKDWVLLLQIGSEDEKTGMMWGDVGRLYFWIKKQDLAAGRFDETWFVLQCH